MWERSDTLSRIFIVCVVVPKSLSIDFCTADQMNFLNLKMNQNNTLFENTAKKKKKMSCQSMSTRQPNPEQNSN